MERMVGGPLTTLADETLAQRAASGDRLALEVLLRRHQQLVHRLCRRLCLDDAEALDASQEALITVIRRIDRFDGRAAFTTWLYRVATNACLDHLRRLRRRPHPVGSVGHDSPGDAAPAEPPSDEPDIAERAVERLALDAALGELPPEFRAAVVLRDVVGLDYAAIGEVLDIPPGTVRSRIARGRAHLARSLTSGGRTEPAGGNQAPHSPRPTERATSAPATTPAAAASSADSTSPTAPEPTHEPDAPSPIRSPQP